MFKPAGSFPFLLLFFVKMKKEEEKRGEKKSFLKSQFVEVWLVVRVLENNTFIGNKYITTLSILWFDIITLHSTSIKWLTTETLNPFTLKINVKIKRIL